MLVEPIERPPSGRKSAPGLLLLAAVAALVLLIACVNLGLLLLSRTVDRRGELGLRAALGASRGRIVRAAGRRVPSSFGRRRPRRSRRGRAHDAGHSRDHAADRPARRPDRSRSDRSGVLRRTDGADRRSFARSGRPCSCCAAICSRRSVVASAATTGDRGVMASRRVVRDRPGRRVVVLLLVGSGLLLRSFWRLQHVDLGFSADDVVTMEMRLVNPKYQEPGRVAAFNRGAAVARSRHPGVARAGLTTAVPMRGVDFMIGHRPDRTGASSATRGPWIRSTSDRDAGELLVGRTS